VWLSRIGARAFRDKEEPANVDWNRDPDIEEELDFPNADTLEESLRVTVQVQRFSE
jgi:hypothetical protein